MLEKIYAILYEAANGRLKLPTMLLLLILLIIALGDHMAGDFIRILAFVLVLVILFLMGIFVE